MTHKNMTAKVAPMCVVLAGVLWGMMGIFVRRLGGMELATMDVVAVRVLCTALLLAMVCCFFDRSAFRIRLGDCWCFVGTGVASITFFNFCYFRTITMTSLSMAAVLLYTAPSFVMLMSSLLFRERITRRKVLAVALAFLGCVLVSFSGGGGGGRVSVGAFFTGLGAGVGYALYTIFGRYALLRGYSSLSIMLWTFLFAAVGVLPFANIPLVLSVAMDSVSSLLFVMLFAIMGTLLPYALYTFGLSHVDSSTAAVLASVEPAAASIAGIVLFSEPVTAGGIGGVLLVLASIFLIR